MLVRKIALCLVTANVDFAIYYMANDTSRRLW